MGFPQRRSSIKWTGCALAAMLWQQGETVCDSIDQWEITDCLVPASTSSCKVRCYFPYDNGLMTEATAPDSQREALTDFGQACGSDTWSEPGASVNSNWCDGLVSNSECTNDDVVYDPCTGLVMQTNTLDSVAWSYTYSDTHAWIGVACDASSGMVTDLGLSDFRVGTDTGCDFGATNFSALSSLSNLHLDNNDLSGSLPPWLASQSSLETLSLDANALTGTLPSALVTELPLLTTLTLSDNSLSGAMPTTTALSATLTELQLSNNQFTGPFPSPLSSSMQYLDVSHNAFTGPLPSIAAAPLTYFLANHNFFTGGLKGLDGACTTTLQYLNLENNTLNGSIPSVLPSMTALQWALFGHNAFSGFLPALPSSASKYSFWGADTAYRCPFPDHHPAWKDVDCDCNGGYFCPFPPLFNATIYYASTPGNRQDGCEYNCTACSAGSIADGLDFSSTCAACGLGTQQPLDGTETCELCAAGTFANETGTALCAPCGLGTATAIEGQAECSACEVGTYADVTGSLACLACPNGTVATQTGAHQCEYCSAGKVAVNASYCAPCQAGSFKANTATLKCELCAVGSYEPHTGRAKSCRACPKGTYGPSRGLVTCVACGPGTFAAQNGTGTEGCDACTPGRYQNANGSISCEACAKGQYQPTSSAIECEDCGAGTYNNVTGAFNVSFCLACTSGQYNSGEGGGAATCALCPQGSYGPFSVTGLSECLTCSEGTYQPGLGSSNCSNCPAGTFNNDTATSFALHDSLADCTVCPAGTYEASTGQSNCSSCPLGTFLAAVPLVNDTASRHDSISDCDACAAGRYGAYTGLTTCKKCSSGRYLNETAATSSDACQACSRGTFSALGGSIECDPCPPRKYQEDTGGSFCHIVTQGYYFINATHVPRACPSGSYTNIDGANNCSLCPKGYTSNESPNKGADGCQACSVGQYANTVGAPKCSQVPAGYASNRTASTGVSLALDACNSGYYQDLAGQAFCKAASPGSFVPPNITGAYTAYFPCPIGTFSSIYGASQCKACLPGAYCPSTGLSAGLPCAAGTYSDTSGATACEDCEAGSFQGDIGSISCELCPPGRVQPNTGSALGPASEGCAACPDGSFSDVNGSTTCGTCKKATYSNDARTGCVDECADGFVAVSPSSSFSSSSSSSSTNTECQPCPMNSYQASTASGKGECILCPDGYDTKNTTGAVACTVATSADDQGARSNVVAGFNLDDPTQAGSFYTIVGVVAIVGLCACAIFVQMLLRVRADRRRAREKMARVSSGLWNEELIYAIPEGDNTKSLDSSSTPLISEESEIGFNGGGSGIEMTAMASKAESGVTIEPEDNPYSLIKRKVLKSPHARHSVEAAFIERELRAHPPPNATAFVVVSTSAPVWRAPRKGAAEVCRKHRGDLVFCSAAMEGWVQLHRSHGDRHGGGAWMSVRRRPNRQTEGAAPLEFGVGSGGVSSELMRQQAHANGPMNHFADVVDAATAASANAPAPTPPSPFAGLRAAAASKTSSAAHVLSRGWESAAAAGGGGLGGYSGMSAREPKSDGFTPLQHKVLKSDFYLLPVDLEKLKESHRDKLKQRAAVAESAGSTGAGSNGSNGSVLALRQSKSRKQQRGDTTANAVPKRYVDHLASALGLLLPDVNNSDNDHNSSDGSSRGTVIAVGEGSSSCGSSSSSSPSLLHLAIRGRRGKAASQGWWVGLSDALGLFADDDDDDYKDGEGSYYKDTTSLLNSQRDDRKKRSFFSFTKSRSRTTSATSSPHGTQAYLNDDNGDHERLSSRLAFVEGGDRAMALAMLEERANVSVLRVMAAHDYRVAEAENAAPLNDTAAAAAAKYSTSMTHHHHHQGQAPDGSVLPPASDRLSKPPLDVPEPPPMMHETEAGVLVWPPPQGLPPGLPLEVEDASKAAVMSEPTSSDSAPAVEQRTPSVQQTWQMPKQVAVVRVAPFRPSSSSLSQASSPPPLPPPSSLPAVFGLSLSNNNNNASSSSNVCPSSSLSAPENVPPSSPSSADALLSALRDLPPLDLPLPPQPVPVSLSLMDLSTIKSSSKLRQGLEGRRKAETTAEQSRLQELEAQHAHQRYLNQPPAMTGNGGNPLNKQDAQQQQSPQRARGFSSPQLPRALGFSTQPKAHEPAELLEEATQRRAAAEAYALGLRDEALAVMKNASHLDGHQGAAHAASKFLKFRSGRQATKLDNESQGGAL